jgi:hypothetical protein
MNAKANGAINNTLDNLSKAIVSSAIVADSLTIDDEMRKRVISKIQDLEDLRISLETLFNTLKACR